jgi:hypothetical protein
MLGVWGSRTERTGVMLTVGMVVLGLATFAVLIGFVALCDRV